MVSWADRALANAKVMAAKAAEVSKEIAADADAALAEKRPGYVAAKAEILAAGKEARVAGAAKLASAGQTQSGAAVGSTVRNVTGKLGQLPVLSAPLDAAKAHYGVAELAAAFKADPENPMSAVQLAEALEFVEHDMRAYRVVRATVDPAYLIHRKLVMTAAQLGKDDVDPTKLALLKRAFRVARSKIAQNPEDAPALHALGRVYLVQGDPHHGAVASALASRTGEDPLALITLARCHAAMGQDARAHEVASEAAQHGATYAYEFLAQLALTVPGQRRAEAVAQFEQLRSRVTPSGRAEYLGTSVDVSEVWGAVRKMQRERTIVANAKVREKWNGLGT